MRAPAPTRGIPAPMHTIEHPHLTPSTPGEWTTILTLSTPRRRRVPGGLTCGLPPGETTDAWIAMVCMLTGILILDFELPDKAATTIAVEACLPLDRRGPQQICEGVGVVTGHRISMQSVYNHKDLAESLGVFASTSERFALDALVLDVVEPPKEGAA